MQLPRRRFLQLTGALALPALPASAQAWPSRPLRWVIGYPAGSSTDLVARIMGQWLSERLGQAVVIENRPGAAANLATQTVVNAPPDGYTLLLALATKAINVTLYESLPFNFLRDIAPVAGLAEFPLVMEVTAAAAARNVTEFVAYAKANPGKINIASFGNAGLADPTVKAWLADVGATPIVMTPAAFGAMMAADAARWAKVIRLSGVKPE